MERVKITLMDNNYTQVLDTHVYIDAADLDQFNSLLGFMRDGLRVQHEHYLSFSGPLKSSMSLTVTDFEHL
jgi:hypothetical protein